MKERVKNKILKVKNNKVVKNYLGHPLFAGSFVMIVGSNFANFISYIYHLFVGRMLGPESYGELAAIISLMGLFAATFSFLGLVIVKFVSAAKENQLQGLFSWFMKKALFISVAIGGLVVILTPFISEFLHLRNSLVIMLAPIFCLTVISLVYRSFLQGLLKFKELVLSTNFDVVGRLIFGLILIFLGFSVFGAVLGMLLSTIAALLLLRYYLRDYRFNKSDSSFKDGKKVFSYSAPILLASVSTFSLFSSDVILVKHFFDAYEAGIYAALSTLGKVIFFGTAPVSSVMFPLISKRHAQGMGYKKILLMSMGLTLVISCGVLVIYYVFPELMITILYGEKYISASVNLFWFGLFMAIFTLGSLVLNFYLSREKTKVVIFVVAAAIIQILGIWFFHGSILTVIKVSIFSASLLLVSLLIYFVHEIRNRQAR